MRKDDDPIRTTPNLDTFSDTGEENRFETTQVRLGPNAATLDDNDNNRDAGDNHQWDSNDIVASLEETFENVKSKGKTSLNDMPADNAGVSETVEPINDDDSVSQDNEVGDKSSASFPTPTKLDPLDRETSSSSSSVASAASSSSSSSRSRGSANLNPNSTILQDDLPGIALLKEIFPDENTDSLRQLHHQHILADRNRQLNEEDQDKSHRLDFQDNPNTTTGSIGENAPTVTTRPRNPLSTATAIGHPQLSVNNDRRTVLPDDFLRLPISVAVLRPVHEDTTSNDDEKGKVHTHHSQNRIRYRYEMLSDLQERAMNEYNLCMGVGCQVNMAKYGDEHFEFLCLVVKKHDRWGLGMTLQEDEGADNMRGRKDRKTPPDDKYAANAIAAPRSFGLKVVGFLPDIDKIRRGEIVTDISVSPAQTAGVQLSDTLIGVNGSAFVLPRFSSTLYSSGAEYDNHCHSQKSKIVQSIQKSPDPVVIHVRRKKPSFTTESASSALPSSNSPSSVPRSKSLLDIDSEQNVKTPPSQNHSTPKPVSKTAPSTSKEPPPIPATPRTPSPSKQFTKHPFAHALVQRHLIRPGDDEWRITSRLQQFTDRTRQWESSSALRLKVEAASNRSSYSPGTTLLPYFDPKDLPPEMAALIVYSNQDQRSKNPSAIDNHTVLTSFYAPSTPSLPHDSPLIPIEYLQAFYGEEQARQIVLLRSREEKRKESTVINKNSPSSQSYPALRLLTSPNKWLNGVGETKPMIQGNNLAWVPLHGIRKSLSARIVNSFVEETPLTNHTSSTDLSMNSDAAPRMAYTIWVYDVESGNEWYAPVRYWKDFCDLRDAAMELLPDTSNAHRELSSIKFPREPPIPATGPAWGPIGSAVFGSRFSKRLSPMSPFQQKRNQRQAEEFEKSRHALCCILEDFLRELLGVVYTCQPLQPSVAEIALYVQSFLGVDAGIIERPRALSGFEDETTEVDSSAVYAKREIQTLKRSIQRYTWRIFMLHTMKAIVRDFVEAAQARGPGLDDVEVLESEGDSALKSKATEELQRIQSFLNQLVDLIVDGCREDFHSIGRRLEYATVRGMMNDQVEWDRLVREAVRMQVEIEVYVPLRSVVSRFLVNGWRHEDMESSFKIKELQKRPQHLFRIPTKNISPTDWQSVAEILKHGVGMSTLPCIKLQAIVQAAREISRLHEREHGKETILGADDFLPIFIFCVVRAEMERPCALCVLLKTLCDKNNQIGEVGYFLASFEAAITHIQEIDLSVDRDAMLSFSSMPLTDVSLGD